MIQGEKQHKLELPRQVLLLCLFVFNDTLNITVVFPFVVFATADMLGKDITDPSVDTYAGILAGCYPLGEFFSSFYMGSFSDYIRRRKPLLAFGQIVNVIMYPIFGYIAGHHGYYWYAFAIRFSMGFLNGNIGLARTCVGETCVKHAKRIGGSPDTVKTLVGKGFGLMSVFYPIGSSAGALLGGIFSQPAQKYGGHWPELLRKHEYMLPCIMTACCSLAMFICCLTFLEETYAYHPKPNDPEEKQSLLGQKAPPKKLALTSLPFNVWLAAIMDGILGYYFNSFHEIFPLWAKTPTSDYGISFSMIEYLSSLTFPQDSTEIGIALGITGPLGAIFQIFFFSKVMKFLKGPRNVFRVGMCITAVVVLATPSMTFIRRNSNSIILWCVIPFVQGFRSIGFGLSFASIFMMISEIGKGPHSGQITGMSHSFESLGKTAGPLSIGSIYAAALGMDFPSNPYLPFLILAGLAVVELIMIANLTLPKPGAPPVNSEPAKHSTNNDSSDEDEVIPGRSLQEIVPNKNSDFDEEDQDITDTDPFAFSLEGFHTAVLESESQKPRDNQMWTV